METMNFIAGEMILAFHGPLIYEAKVLECEMWDKKQAQNDTGGPHYLIHYAGWKKNWDEWVPQNRLLKKDRDGLDRQRALREMQKHAQTTLVSSKARSNPSGSPGVQQAAGSSKAGAAATGRSQAGTPIPMGPPVGEKKTVITLKDVKGKKRTRETAFDTEMDFMKRPEVKIPIPDSLKVKLVDDWEYVTKNQQLVTLPRDPTVKTIIEEYKDYVAKKKEVKEKITRQDALVTEVMAGLVVYFDKALGNNLLYKFERGQYTDVRRRLGDDTPLSEIYGAEHLLRLFVNLPSFIAHTNMDTESINLLREHITEFLKWMVKEQTRLFQKDYEQTTSQYQAQART